MSPEWHRDYYKRNREKLLARSKARYAANSEKILDAEKKRRQDDPESFRAKQRAWNKGRLPRKREIARETYRRRKLKDPEWLRNSRQQWRNENKDKANASSREWKRRNPAKVSVARQRRRALRRSAPGTFSEQQLIDKCAFHGWRCYLCSSPLTPDSMHADHRQPLCRGGSNWIANIAPACASCNLRKNKKTEAEFRAIK